MEPKQHFKVIVKNTDNVLVYQKWFENLEDASEYYNRVEEGHHMQIFDPALDMIIKYNDHSK